MNLDVREYLRTNPISCQPSTDSDSDLDCLLLFDGKGGWSATTQGRLFKETLTRLLGSAIVEGDDGKLRLNCEWDVEAQALRWLSKPGFYDSIFQNYAKRSELEETANGLLSQARSLLAEVRDRIQRLSSGNGVDYDGAVELMSRADGAYSGFRFALGLIWCVQSQSQSSEAGADRAELSTIKAHVHPDTSVEATLRSLAGGEMGHDHIGEGLGDGSTTSVGKSTLTMAASALSMDETLGLVDGMAVPMSGLPWTDFRCTDRTWNNLPPSHNVYVRYRERTASSRSTAQPRGIAAMASASPVESVPKDSTYQFQEYQEFLDITPKVQNTRVPDMEDFPQDHLTKSDLYLRLVSDVDGNGQVQDVQLASQNLQTLIGFFSSWVGRTLQTTVRGSDG